MVKLIYFFYGYYKIEADKNRAVELINIMKRYNIEYWGLKYSLEGDLNFKILLSEYKKLLNILDKTDCMVYIVYEKGLPYYIRRYKKRLGIPVGILIFIVMLWLSTLFIWDIEVKGNYSESDEQIIERLNELGCGVGSFIPSIDFERLCNSYILKYDDASWISVNLNGTVANVEMREELRAEPKDDDNRPRNLIAKCDGYIESYQVTSGKRMVEVSTVVRKGDLLISGIAEYKNGREVLVKAVGLVNAVTNRNFEVNIPLNYTRKTYTGVSDIKKSVKLFGKNINFYINNETFIENYDKIVDVNRIILFGVIKLPVIIQTDTYNEYCYAPWELTEAEAEILAEREMSALLFKELKHADILEQTVTAGIIGGEYVINCDIRCLEDIAEPSVILTY
jgi:Putative stage IV sporulation protein YqfD.